MVRRDGLTQEDVFEAASQLRATGKQVTALKILTMLGGGSLTTIYKYLEQWEASNRTAEKSADDDEIPEAVMRAFRNVWRLAVSQERDKAAHREARLIGQIDALKSTNEKLLSRLAKKGSKK